MQEATTPPIETYPTLPRSRRDVALVLAQKSQRKGAPDAAWHRYPETGTRVSACHRCVCEHACRESEMLLFDPHWRRAIKC
ncbi:hypothetical protein Baya_7202 [Bagarius yarrelli]|uniref:Uncharacterized protein n=1 Tax=Bagarius yarrelli TaxID=175774 RepID=A0A556TZJ9_BAGYA|nr:hypothetical protein Baya_7202 [Bagarius yarrelli]